MELLTEAKVHRWIGDNCSYFKAPNFVEIVELICNYRREKGFHYRKIVYCVEKDYIEALVHWRLQ